MRPMIVLYHSVLGIRQGEKNMAELMRKLGFEVSLPDLYEGKVFDDYREALVLFEEIGIAGLIEQAQKAFTGTEGSVIFAGFSNGGALAEVMALQYPQTVACLLFHAALPIEQVGASEWPEGIDVQVHYADGDPWREEGYVEKFLEQVKESGSKAELVEYRSKNHLFSDSTLPNEYSAEETRKLYKHVENFLSKY